MNIIYILTMVIMASTTSQNRAMTSVVVEYTSKQACELALLENISKLQRADVILGTCTKK